MIEKGPGEEQIGAVDVSIRHVDDVGREIERERRDVDDHGNPKCHVGAVACQERRRQRLGPAAEDRHDAALGAVVTGVWLLLVRHDEDHELGWQFDLFLHYETTASGICADSSASLRRCSRSLRSASVRLRRRFWRCRAASARILSAETYT